ncbi:DUF3179 domain-containing protein [Halorussus marinus]|uniref:DUF3179 domain-containing protein n=1 Tax=Halorussus marinus TaxID=2505976 RepID=UPI001091FAFD|nr:DUF3179 domain-containing protein [Halorussus marinus]
MTPTSRRRFLGAVAAAVSLAGCTSAGPSVDDAAESTTAGTASPTASRVEAGIPLARSTLPVEHEFDALRSEIQNGGPPKDGIPSIDEPTFRPAEAADADLDDRAVVFGVVRNGEAKAYPRRILVHHEVANDAIGGEPVAITYCPLTGTAMGFRRGETEFGVSGDLVNNNLIMYDRETDSRWPQILGTAISGPLEGESLREFRLVWTRWGRWKAAVPETAVLTEETGHVRDYGTDPYGTYVPNRGGYYDRDSTLFPALGDDDTFPAKRVVIGARTDEGRIAFEADALREDRLLSGTAGDTPHLAVYDSELETGYVYRNPDGASFDYEDGRAIAGDATAHDPAALPLDRAYAFDAMWFAWSGFYPSTAVVG